MTTLVFGNNTGDDYSGTQGGNIHDSSPTVWDYSWDFSKFTTGDERRGLVRFPSLSNLPASISVSSAAVSLYLDTSTGNGRAYTSYRLLRNWVYGDASWTYYNNTSTLSWTSPGAMGSGTDRASSASATSVTVNGSGSYYDVLQDSAQLRTDIQNFASGANQNYGWQVERTDGAYDANYQFFRTETDADGTRPKLTVVFTAGGGGGGGATSLPFRRPMARMSSHFR